MLIRVVKVGNVFKVYSCKYITRARPISRLTHFEDFHRTTQKFGIFSLHLQLKIWVSHSTESPKKRWKMTNKKIVHHWRGLQYVIQLGISQAFFHRFCGNKHNRFSETLSLRYKSLSLGDNYLSLGKNLEFRRHFLRFHTEKLHFLPKISLNFPDFLV